MEFVLSASAENPGKKYRFAQASVTDLPFADKAFDTTIVSFTIHHVDDVEGRLMSELLRVTRSYLIIFDHLRSDNPLADALQDTYWRVFDGGCNYMRWSQWEKFLTGTTVVKKIRTGAIFGHVIKMVCTIP
jgi:ubiquinone/menaquinone biosynthesis C-methylase UbiE